MERLLVEMNDQDEDDLDEIDNSIDESFGDPDS